MEIRKLKANEINVKVKKVTGKGCLLLLYKDARVDMAILDETYGPNNWQCDYKTINGALYCGIGIYDPTIKEWVWKWDCGIESRADDEGNEKKGEASDAFKRAGFKIGIGRELYTAPFIWANVPTQQIENSKGVKTWVLVNQFQKFIVDNIEYNQQGEISHLLIVDEKGNKIYSGRKQ